MRQREEHAGGHGPVAHQQPAPPTRGTPAAQMKSAVCVPAMSMIGEAGRPARRGRRCRAPRPHEAGDADDRGRQRAGGGQVDEEVPAHRVEQADDRLDHWHARGCARGA